MLQVDLPNPVPLDERTNERYEMPGEGFEDQYGNPTREGVWYKLADHEPSGSYGVIVAGPFAELPHLQAARDAAGEERLFITALADAIGRVGHAHSGRIAAALATEAQVAAHHGRTELAFRLHDIVADIMSRALYYDRHPLPSGSFQIIELASSERV